MRVTLPSSGKAAKMPVITMPTMPPTPWQGKTSSVSSSVDLVRRCTAMLLMTLATRPMKMLSGTVTKPAAGVMATRPTTAPMQAPRAEGFLPRNQSKKIQPSMAAALAVLVVAKATAAVPLAARRTAGVEAEPAEPEHAGAQEHVRDVGRRDAPLLHVPRPRPSTIAPASAANPADMCTTVPPAKSFTPQLKKRPSGVPRHVRQRAVDQEAEQAHEQQSKPRTAPARRTSR